MEAITVGIGKDIGVARTRIMPVGDRNERILDIFRRELTGLDGWLEMVMGGRKFRCREESSVNPRILAPVSSWVNVLFTDRGNRRRDSFGER